MVVSIDIKSIPEIVNSRVGRCATVTDHHVHFFRHLGYVPCVSICCST